LARAVIAVTRDGNTDAEALQVGALQYHGPELPNGTD
jgi:hypothetical protein